MDYHDLLNECHASAKEGVFESKVNEEEFAEPSMQKPGKKLPRKKLHKKVAPPEKPEELEDPKPEDIKPDKDLDPDAALTDEDKPKASPDTDNEPAPVDDDVPPPPDEVLEPEQPIEMRKEYLGKTEDTYYYFVTTEGEGGNIADFVLVDQEGAKKFTASEHEIEIAEENIADFIIDAIRDVKVSSIERSIFMKYIYPKLIEDSPSDEEFLEEPNADKTEEEKRTRSEEEGAAPPEEVPRESKVREAKENLKFKNFASGSSSRMDISNYFMAIYTDEGKDDHYPVMFSNRHIPTEIAEKMLKVYDQYLDDSVEEKKKCPTCDKCSKAHWPYQKCSDKKGPSPKMTDEEQLARRKEDHAVIVGDGIQEDISRKEALLRRIEKLKKKKEDDDKEHQRKLDQYEKELRSLGKNESLSNLLTETKVVDTAGNEFTVYLLDEGGTDTVIEVNGRKFNFSQDFASMWRDEAGVITEAGLKELALDALANLGEEEHAELVSQAIAEEPEEFEEPMDENQLVKKLLEDVRVAMEAELDVFDQMSIDELLDAVGETRKDLPEKEDLIDELMLRKFGKEYSGYLKRQVGIESKENNEGVTNMNREELLKLAEEKENEAKDLRAQITALDEAEKENEGKNPKDSDSPETKIKKLSEEDKVPAEEKSAEEAPAVDEAKIDETDVAKGAKALIGLAKEALKVGDYAKAAEHCQKLAEIEAVIPAEAEKEVDKPAVDKKEDKPKDEPKEDTPKDDKPKEDDLDDLLKDESKEDDKSETLHGVDEAKDKEKEAKEEKAKKEKEAKAKKEKEVKAKKDKKEKEAKAKKDKKEKEEKKAKAKKESRIQIGNKVDLSESKGETRLRDLLNL